MIYSIITHLAPYYGTCTKIDYKGYEISIAFDSSCRENYTTLTRGELRVYKKDVDVTSIFCEDDIFIPTLEALVNIKNKIDSLNP